MKILIYGINYKPEQIGIGRYTAELCEWLVERGYEVEVITALPYYPEWRIRNSYRNKGWYSEIINGVKVYRTPLFVPRKVTGYTRILHEFSFLLSSGFHWIRAIFKKYDLVFCIYPPLVIGLYPLIYRLIHRKPVWIHVQDLQVDAAREFGIIRHEILLKLAEGLEKKILQKVQIVSTISEGMKERIVKKGLKEDQVKILPNWVDLDEFYPMQDLRGDLKIKFGFLPLDKIVLYSGNIGDKQGLEIVLDVAEDYQKNNPEIKFIIIGDGSQKRNLISRSVERGLENVQFRKFVPSTDLPSLLNMADIHLVLMRKGASSLVMPSKLGNILACGGISIVAADPDSYLYKILSESKVAYLCIPGNEESFRKTLDRAFLNDEGIDANHVHKFTHCYMEKNSIMEFYNRIFKSNFSECRKNLSSKPHK